MAELLLLLVLSTGHRRRLLSSFGSPPDFLQILMSSSASNEERVMSASVAWWPSSLNTLLEAIRNGSDDVSGAMRSNVCTQGKGAERDCLKHSMLVQRGLKLVPRVCLQLRSDGTTCVAHWTGFG
jgi:hypothetical protein